VNSCHPLLSEEQLPHLVGVLRIGVQNYWKGNTPMKKWNLVTHPARIALPGMLTVNDALKEITLP
jgi:hypothetical protein